MGTDKGRKDLIQLEHAYQPDSCFGCPLASPDSLIYRGGRNLRNLVPETTLTAQQVEARRGNWNSRESWGSGSSYPMGYILPTSIEFIVAEHSMLYHGC